MKKNLIVGLGFVGCLISTACVSFIAGSKYVRNKTKECGNLRIDKSEEDEPFKIFFEISDTHSLMTSEYVVLKVVKENYITHKN